jgi:hypothetical protein
MSIKNNHCYPIGMLVELSTSHPKKEIHGVFTGRIIQTTKENYKTKITTTQNKYQLLFDLYPHLNGYYYKYRFTKRKEDSKMADDRQNSNTSSLINEQQIYNSSSVEDNQTVLLNEKELGLLELENQLTFNNISLWNEFQLKYLNKDSEQYLETITFNSDDEMIGESSSSSKQIEYNKLTLKQKIFHIEKYEKIILEENLNQNQITSHNEYESINNLKLGSIKRWTNQKDNLYFVDTFPPLGTIDLNLTQIPPQNAKFHIEYINLGLENNEMISLYRGKSHTSQIVKVDWTTITDVYGKVIKMLGLFAKRDIKPREYIGNYLGKLIIKADTQNNSVSGKYTAIVSSFPTLEPSSREIENENYDSSDDASEAFEWGIDASDPLSCFARFANCSPPGVNYNASLKSVKYSEDDESHAIELRAGKMGIKRGDEIFLNYGSNYWKNDSEFYPPDDPEHKLSLLLMENEKLNEKNAILKRSNTGCSNIIKYFFNMFLLVLLQKKKQKRL